MPLTLAHPAAVIPLHRSWGSRAPLSALVIGSMIPDLAYVLPIDVERATSHSVSALVWFCLPLGCLSYVVLHAVVKGPLLALFPAAAQRLDPRPSNNLSHSASAMGVACAVLVGAATHVLWDAFTHAGAPAVTAIPFLQRELFALGGYQVFVFKLLQHGSTALGLAAIAVSLRSWWRRPCPTMSSEPQVDSRQRVVGGAILAGFPLVMGSLVFLQQLSFPLSVLVVQRAVGGGVRAALAGALLGILAVGALWRWLPHAAGRRACGRERSA